MDSPKPSPLPDMELRMSLRDPEGPGVLPDVSKIAQAMMADIVGKLQEHKVQPDQAVAILLITTIGILGPIIEQEPHRRGKLVNLMTSEYRRLLQRYLPMERASND